ncbi:MAG: GDP-mannose 4,6-dehydratase [Methanomicrobiales archaeon]
MRILVTGASGFTGSWMLQHLSNLVQTDLEIIALVNSKIPSDTEKNGITYIKGDLLDFVNLKRHISSLIPDRVIHLAGLNRGTLYELLNTNVVGTKNLLDVLQSINDKCRVLVISSSSGYGYAGDHPISETSPLMPLSEYGISKMGQDVLCEMFYKNKGTHVAIARPFNLVGPGLSSLFVCGGIIRQVIEIEKGKKQFIDLLEIASCRDFIDVRDAVAAYWSLLSHPEFEHMCIGKAFNVGSGNAHTISSVIESIEEITGEKYIVHLASKLAYISIPTQRSDNTHIHKTTGWSPKIPLKKSLRDMLEVARKNS